jgi:hypothetical protein
MASHLHLTFGFQLAPLVTKVNDNSTNASSSVPDDENTGNEVTHGALAPTLTAEAKSSKRKKNKHQSKQSREAITAHLAEEKRLFQLGQEYGFPNPNYLLGGSR